MSPPQISGLSIAGSKIADKADRILRNRYGPLLNISDNLVKLLVYPIHMRFAVKKDRLFKGPADDGRRLEIHSQLENQKRMV